MLKKYMLCKVASSIQKNFLKKLTSTLGITGFEKVWRHTGEGKTC